MKNIFEKFNYDNETLDYLLHKLEEYDYGEPFITLFMLHQSYKIGEEKKHREKVLKYLLPLLKNNELVMLVHQYDINNPSKLVGTRISTPETAEEDIDILRKE